MLLLVACNSDEPKEASSEPEEEIETSVEEEPVAEEVKEEPEEDKETAERAVGDYQVYLGGVK